MLSGMIFINLVWWLPDIVVELIYLCNKVGTVSFQLSRVACCILNVADKHGIIPIPAHIPTHLNVKADYLL